MSLKVKLLCAALVLFSVELFAETQLQSSEPEHGVLYIHGGGSVSFKSVLALIKKETGKADPRICVITTALGESRKQEIQQGQEFFMIRNFKLNLQHDNIFELYLETKKDANDLETVQRIEGSDAIWMTGGKQMFLTDALLGTKTHAAMNALLDRGGVIAGASAGAQVQSSFMTRGGAPKRSVFGDGAHQVGLNFVKNIAFDVHVMERNRQNDLFELYEPGRLDEITNTSFNQSQTLAIGIDQSTAIIIKDSMIEVSGKHSAYIFDPLAWTDGDRTFRVLKDGDRFDLKKRIEVESKNLN